MTAAIQSVPYQAVEGIPALAVIAIMLVLLAGVIITRNQMR
jgi:hypothetical protein